MESNNKHVRDRILPKVLKMIIIDKNKNGEIRARMKIKNNTPD